MCNSCQSFCSCLTQTAFFWVGEVVPCGARRWQVGSTLQGLTRTIVILKRSLNQCRDRCKHVFCSVEKKSVSLRVIWIQSKLSSSGYDKPPTLTPPLDPCPQSDAIEPLSSAFLKSAKVFRTAFWILDSVMSLGIEVRTFSVAFKCSKSWNACISFHRYLLTLSCCRANRVRAPLRKATSMATLSDCVTTMTCPYICAALASMINSCQSSLFALSKMSSRTNCKRSPSSDNIGKRLAATAGM